MSKASFTIFYEGPALEKGLMDVRDLAPSLLAFGNLLESANQVLNKEATTVKVNLKAGFKKGSFGVDFEIGQSVVESIRQFLSWDEYETAWTILERLGMVKEVAITATGVGFGLVKLLRKTKGKKPDRVKIEEDNVTLEFDSEKFELQRKTFELYRNLKVRESLRKAFKPLASKGIESISTAHEQDRYEVATQDDTDSFEIPDTEAAKIEETVQTLTLSLDSVSFKEGNKWKLSDGTNTFWVSIGDHKFLEQVDNNEISFSKGDLLRARLKTTQWEGAKGLQTEYEVIEVLEHRKAAKQMLLF